MSEIERKRAYVCQGCPKGTTKAINSALLVTPTGHTHSNYLHMHAPYSKSVLSLLSSLSSAQKSPDPEFWANLRVLLVAKVSEIERKRAYVRQGCPKATTKAINSAFCWSRLLVTPTAIICICMRHTLNRFCRCCRLCRQHENRQIQSSGRIYECYL